MPDPQYHIDSAYRALAAASAQTWFSGLRLAEFYGYSQRSSSHRRVPFGLGQFTRGRQQDWSPLLEFPARHGSSPTGADSVASVKRRMWTGFSAAGERVDFVPTLKTQSPTNAPVLLLWGRGFTSGLGAVGAPAQG